MIRAVALAAIVAVAPRVEAHALYVECKLRGETVRVEAYFDDDTPAAAASVVVRTKAGDEIARGTTGDNGFFEFAKPAADKYVVIVDAGQGHRAEQTITIPTNAALEKLGAFDLNAPEVIITPGPTRTERVRFPWLRVGLGLASIAGLAGVLWLGLRRKGVNTQRSD